MFRNLDEVTYESFGIDPKTFYKSKFNNPSGIDLFENPLHRLHVDSGRLRFLLGEIRGKNVLDLGCGGGPYGYTLKKHLGLEVLTGLDMDGECLNSAQKSGYDRTVLQTAMDHLPFPDNSFDTVFSSDFFGHIEFRYKTALVSEIARILKPGGRTVHVIESGECDYLHCNPDDPNDSIRKYVWEQGHVGVESPASLRKRFGQFFPSVQLRNAMLFPFFTVDGILAHKTWFPEFPVAPMEQFTDSQKEACAQVVGFLNDFIQKALLDEDPAALDPTSDSNLPRALRRGCGLIYLIAEKQIG